MQGIFPKRRTDHYLVVGTACLDMIFTLTHELVHLLSDQHYNSVSAARNRWFFEATAEYFAARARGLSEAARGGHYAHSSINADVYLSIPIFKYKRIL